MGALGVALVALTVVLLALSIPADEIPHAVSYTVFDGPLPPPPRPNTLLMGVSRLEGVYAPEGFAEVSVNGTVLLFMSCGDGRIARLRLERGRANYSLDEVVYVARTGRIRDASCDRVTKQSEPQCGRPLGLLWIDGDGLYAADVYSGLMRISQQQALAPRPPAGACGCVLSLARLIVLLQTTSPRCSFRATSQLL